MIQPKLTLFGYRMVITLLLFVMSGQQPAALAQSSRQWSPDERVPGYADETFTPYLLADQNQTVHLFANQLVGDPNPQLAILYRQWRRAGGWTTPVDILLAPDGGDAQILGAFLDQQGMIHVAFLGGQSESAKLYYARAPATEAGRAPAWSPPAQIGDGASFPSSGVLAGDQREKLVVIYSGRSVENGVYATYSTDAGASWSKPAPFFLTYDAKLSTFSVNAYMDAKSQFHAVWSVVTDKGVNEAVYYARFDLTNQQWHDPVMLEQRIDQAGFFGPSFPSITGYGDTIVVMYNSGNPSAGGLVDAGRPVQRVRQSNDGGQLWTEPITPFPRQLGRSGEHALVVDSNQVVHAIFMQRIETVIDNKEQVIDGPWHAMLQGGQWREPINFPTMWSPHDMRAVVSQGNVILALWREDPGIDEHGIWFSHINLDAPELPVTAIPTIAATPTVVVLSNMTPLPPTATATPVPEIGASQYVTAQSSRNPVGPLIFATAPVLLLFAGLLLVRQWSRRRNRGQ